MCTNMGCSRLRAARFRAAPKINFYSRFSAAERRCCALRTNIAYVDVNVMKCVTEYY